MQETYNQFLKNSGQAANEDPEAPLAQTAHIQSNQFELKESQRSEAKLHRESTPFSLGSEPIMDPFHMQSQNAEAFARQQDPFNQPSSILTDHAGSVLHHDSSGLANNDNNQSVINSLARQAVTSIEKRESQHFTRESMNSKQNGLALTYTETDNGTAAGRDSLGNKYDLPFMPSNIH